MKYKCLAMSIPEDKLKFQLQTYNYSFTFLLEQQYLYVEAVYKQSFFTNRGCG